MAALTQIQSVAHFLWLVEDAAIFSYGDEPRPWFFRLTEEQWRDMGEPKELTLTITPGDSLNG